MSEREARLFSGDDDMELTVERLDVWASGMQDKPGALAAKLAALAEAGADLEFIVARRSPEKPGTGVLFVAPLRGDDEVRAAGQVGFSAANSLHSVRVEGDNRPGVAAEICSRLGKAGINVRGFSAAVIGTRFIAYMAFDTPDAAAKAVGVLQVA
jgi:hypothetical protein